MKDCVRNAFLHDARVTIFLENGEVYTGEILDYDQVGIIIKNECFVEWGEIKDIVYA